jgi:methionyl-tRNA formyltransferase
VRTVYLGTSAFAATVLERLADSPHRPALVVTRPDRPRGRGRRLQAPPVAVTAKVLGIELDQPVDVNGEEARERIAAAAPEVVCVCAFGALLREPLLSEHQMLNVHPSLLPRWRGAAPVERAIIAGDSETGVAIMQVTAGLDSGPVCLVERERILADDTYGSLSGRLAALGGDLLVQALDVRSPCADQDDGLATYAEKIGPEDRRLDPSLPAVELERRVRALTPHVGAFVELPDGSSLGVRAARLAAGGSVPAGTFGSEGGALTLACSPGTLALTEVQPPGKRPMPAADYLRGYGLPG